MSEDFDPLDEGMPRDWQHRPQVMPVKRGGKPDTKAQLVTYTRASTFAKALDDGGGLSTWKVRHAVVGVANSPDLAVMIAALGRNLNTFTRDDKAALDAIVDRAHDRSGGNEKADYGTAVHSITEPDRDFDPLAVDENAARASHEDKPPSMMRDAAAYDALIVALDVEVVGTETFVVNDELATGGTFDHTVKLRSDLSVTMPGGREVVIPAGTVLVVDKKTGTLHLGQHGIQLAIYARGKTYNYRTGERGALDVSPQWGIVAHVPKGKGTAAAYLVDLHAGWNAAKLAAEVRKYRSLGGKIAKVVAEVEAPGSGNAEIPPSAEPADNPNPAPVDEPVVDEAAAVEAAAVENVIAGLGDAVLEAIKAAQSRDECAALWRKYASAGSWRDAHTEAVQARLAALAA